MRIYVHAYYTGVNGGNQPMKRAALYVRVSTPDQHVESQLYDLRELAAQRGFEVVHEYEDRGVCGKKARRPGLDALMADARRKKFSVVLVAAFDRIARSTRNLPASSGRTGQPGNRVCQPQRRSGDGGRDGASFCDDHLGDYRIRKVTRRGESEKWMRRARLEGRQIGRSRLDVDRQQVLIDRRSGMSLTQVAKRHNISRASVCRLMKEARGNSHSPVLLEGASIGQEAHV
jgi:DNA invertase Pin-like site-specific DNA recombinase